MARAPFANDLGPATIDVTSYPSEQQDGYRVFAQKCSKCHTLARPINSQYATRDTWERYVKQMWRKPGSNISGAEAKQIWEFLTYDSQRRKLSDPTGWRSHRQQLLDAFTQQYPARYRELYEGRETRGAIEPQ